jgi:7-cyano-7-deazaguanine synthase
MTEYKSVVVVSGGLDSTTLAYVQKDRGFDVYAISFDYGQRHVKELDYARETMGEIAEDHHIVDLTNLTELFAESGSSLVTGADVPEGHYGEESMKATVVPNRNMIMLSIAAGYAVSINAESVAMGMHAGDHFIYPDCRPEFVVAIEYALQLANTGFAHPSFNFATPFIQKSKNEIAAEAVRLSVPIERTWSCYQGGEIHCGRCGTCVERL